MGLRNVIRSMPAVTTRVPEWRIAAMPATSSHRRMIAPPWTLPVVLASGMPIQRVITEREWAGVRGSTGAGSYGREDRLVGHHPIEPKERVNARTRRSLFNCRQGQDLEDARPGRGPVRDARLRLPEAGRAASEREEGHRGRGHVQEAPSDAAEQARAAGRQARHPGAPGARAGPRGPRPDGSRAQERDADRDAVARLSGRRAREPAEPA